MYKTWHFNGLSASSAKARDCGRESRLLLWPRPTRVWNKQGPKQKYVQKPAQLYRCSQSSAPQQGTASPGRRRRSGRMRGGCCAGSRPPRAAAQQRQLGSNTLRSPQTPTRVPRKLHVHKHHAEPQPLLHKPWCPQTPASTEPAQARPPARGAQSRGGAGARAGQRGWSWAHAAAPPASCLRPAEPNATAPR